MKEQLLAQSLQISGQTIEGPLDSAVILFIVFIWGGYDFMMSGGSPDKIKSARAKITAGLIGFVLLIAAFVIVRLASYIFGLGSTIF